MTKTKEAFSERVNSLFSVFTKVDEEFLEELLEILIYSDVGVTTAEFVIDELRERIKKKRLTEADDVKNELKLILEEILQSENSEEEEKKTVILVVGVNGVGKTTTIGKLANYFVRNRKKVLACAADTFRAAAVEQLTEWMNRSNVELVKKEEGTDPASVVFDATVRAKETKADILICDTAGRLHNKKNLMDELMKINRIIDRELPEYHKEVYLILDATTGQNGVNQAKSFLEATGVTGIVVTKLDGTAKGGMLFSVLKELNIPVKYVGLGEGIDDIEKFDTKKFVEGIL
ncbi:MAG: signal recognition particle-docking protein FtsY [Clostridia bacterium]|nr:signal recognition particle-docking protein FtsY [Clostridia bacterium]